MKKFFLLLFVGIGITLNAQDYCLDVQYIEKEQTNWCGIASTKCVLNYYGFDAYRQCDLAEYVRTDCPWGNLGYYNCCTNPSWGCNSPIELLCLQEILVRFGNIKIMPILNPLEKYGIQNWLQYQRPPIMRWENINNPSHGHAMVIHGIELEDAFYGDYIVYYMDPDPIDNSCNVGGFRRLCYDDLLNYVAPPPINITFKWVQTMAPYFSPHCYNGVPDADETGVDCGGLSCPPCAPPPPPPSCSNCNKDPDEVEIDCGSDDCPPCDDVPEERTITNSNQLRKEVAAFNKITAKANVVVQTGKKVSFITENGGSIVLQPGFKAEKGCTFTTQRWEDVSGCGRDCPTKLCPYIWELPKVCYQTGDNSGLYIYNLLYCKKIEYEIYERLTINGNPYEKFLYKKVKEVTNNGTVFLWNCVTGSTTDMPCKIYYKIYYCNDDDTNMIPWEFTVKGFGKNSLTDDPNDPETPFSPPANNITLPNENPAPSFVIIPNPNPGTFQIETNFPLSQISNLKFINSLGATVYETQTLSSSTIQLPTVASGQHFVMVMLKDGTVLTQKMMLQPGQNH